MTALTEKKAIGFINTIAERCTRCLRRNENSCRNCISSWANEIMKAYHDDQRAEGNKSLDYSLSARMLMIADQLTDAKRPLLASEIDLSKYCTRQLKRWTLKRMVDDGILGRSIARKRSSQARYAYYLKNRKALPAALTADI